MQYKEKVELFKLLGNPIRLQILDILNKKETSLEELTQTLGIRKPNVSQHLAILKYMRIVETRREGKRSFYNITNDRIIQLLDLTKSLKI